MEAQTKNGRVRLDDDRLAEILNVATSVFISKGYSAASTNEIARLANASKGTFYSRFPNKEALFLAVLDRRMQAIFNEVASLLPPDPPVEKTLREFSTKFLNLALSDDQLAIVRVVSMEAQHFPQLGQRFYDLGPKRGQETLTAYMKSQIELGRFVKEDPALMAQQFLSLLGGGPVRWLVLGVGPWQLSKPKQKEHIQATLSTFLRAFQVVTTAR